MITYDLTVNGVHTYFVDNAGVPILVHNEDGCVAGIQAAISMTGLNHLWVYADQMAIEARLGGNLRPNYPGIDSFDEVTKTGTSIKTIDWRADSYVNDPGAVLTRGKSVVNELTNFRDVPDNLPAHRADAANRTAAISASGRSS
jgi:hypothetical protein